MSASNLGATFDLGGVDIWKLSAPFNYQLTPMINLIAEYSYRDRI